MAPSQMVRVYVPMTSSLLRRAREEGAFGPAPLAAQAVTPALEAEVGGDQEECEYAAMTAASLESLAVLGPDDAPRRVVAAVDVPSWEARDGSGPGAVLVPAPVRWRRLAAVLVDGDEAAPDVAAARGAADDDLVERCLDHELGWFAAQEVDQLLAGYAEGQGPR